MRVVRASEIGSFYYCHKAWDYYKKGVPSENSQEMAAGTESHELHGRRVLRAQLIRFGGELLLAVAILLAVVYLIQHWI